METNVALYRLHINWCTHAQRNIYNVYKIVCSHTFIVIVRVDIVDQDVTFEKEGRGKMMPANKLS